MFFACFGFFLGGEKRFATSATDSFLRNVVVPSKPWGELKTIYGFAENLENIKKQGEIILFEGCKSVLMADTWGIHNAGAILTSHLNPNSLPS